MKLNFVEKLHEEESIVIDAISLPSDALQSGEPIIYVLYQKSLHVDILMTKTNIYNSILYRRPGVSPGLFTYSKNITFCRTSVPAAI